MYRSEVLFGDAWLFRSQQQAEASELIAMLGLPLNSGARELSVAHWDSDRACAAEVASALGLKLENLMDDGTSTGNEEGDEGAGAETSRRRTPTPTPRSRRRRGRRHPLASRHAGAAGVHWSHRARH